jgi:hypothetical protein
MPTIDLADDELAAVIAALRETLNRDRYHLAPRLEPFRARTSEARPGIGAAIGHPEGAIGSGQPHPRPRARR